MVGWQTISSPLVGKCADESVHLWKNLHSAVTNLVPLRQAPTMSFTIYSLPWLIRFGEWNKASQKLAEKPKRATRKEDGCLPIHLACESKAPLHLVQELLQAFPASIYETTWDGCTPLDVVRQCQDTNNPVICLLENAQHGASQGHASQQVQPPCKNSGTLLPAELAKKLVWLQGRPPSKVV